MLSLLASYASVIYVFLLNTFASFWLSRARTSTSENATELGFGAVNVVDVVKVNGDVVLTQTLGTERIDVLPCQESDITDYTAYSDEATSAIIRQAFLPSKYAEAMKRYGPVKVVDKDELLDKGANRCSIVSSDDNTSEDRFFSDAESTTSSSMTSVGDELEPPGDAERFEDKKVKDKIEGGLTAADADEDDGKSVGDSRQLSYFEDDESVTDESEDEEFYSFSEESDVPEETRENVVEEVTTTDDVRGESKVLSLGVVESSVRDENHLENAICAAVNDPEGDSTPLSSILEKRSRSSYTLSDDLLPLDGRRNCRVQETDGFEATIIQEEVSTELRGVKEEVVIASNGAGKNKSIPSSQSRLSLSSLEASEEAAPSVPRIVVHSPSLDDIHHQLTPAPLRPCRDDNEDLTEVLEFMQECDLEIPNRFLSSAFEDDSDEESEEGYNENDEYDDFSQAKIFMEPGSMPPGSLHLLRVSDDGTYITIEPFESDDSELRLSPFKSMRKVEMTKPAIPTVVVQSPSMEEMTVKAAQVEIVEFTPAIVARISSIEEVSIHTEPESTHTIGASPSMKDVVACTTRTEAEVVGPIPSIVVQSPSTEDVNVISADAISTETKVVESTPAIVGPSPSIEAIIALLDRSEVEVVGYTSTVESTQEIIDTPAHVIDADLEVVKSTPTTVGPSLSIEAILVLLGLPNHGEVGVVESTPTIVSPSSSMEDIYDTPARTTSTEPESVEPLTPAIIVHSPSLEEIFAMPARTLEEAGLSFGIVHSPSMADLASMLTDPEDIEVEEIESTPSIAPEETPIRPAWIEAEVIQSTPAIVVQSPSMEQIPLTPTRPTRDLDEDITELLDFMNEHDCELPMFATTFGEDGEEDEDSDSMESHDLATTSTESITSFEDEDSDSMKSHDLTTTHTAGMESLTSLEDEWKPIFDTINNNFGIPFAQGRAFLDKAVEWFKNEPKSSWSEGSLSQLSSSSSSDGEIGDILNYYANSRDEVGFDEDESTAVNVEDKDVVAVGENTSSVKTMSDENLTDEGPNELIPWTLFRPRPAPEDYLRVPERRSKRS